MGQSLANAAVSGMSNRKHSEDTDSFLSEGDIDGLLAFHRRTFGGLSMMAGKDDDDADDDDQDDDAEDGNDDDGDDDGDDDDDDDDDKDTESDADRRIKELSAEGKKKRIRIREQKARIAELERELAAKGKTKSKDDEDDSDSEEVASLTADRDKLLTDNEGLRIQVAFLKNAKHAWKNPAAALKLADLSDVEINDDGEVDGLDEALDALAESDPYLLKGKDETDETPKVKKSGQRSGTQRKKGNANRDALLKKYPALRR